MDRPVFRCGPECQAIDVLDQGAQPDSGDRQQWQLASKR